MPHLRIENFKCYRKVTIPFNDLTVLVGANGAGKSSVIQALLLLHKAISYAQSRTIPLNDLRGQNLGTFSDIVYAGDISRRIKLAWDTELPMKSSKASFGVIDEDSALDIKVLYKSIGSNDLTRPDLHFLSADRLGSTVAQPMHAFDFPIVGDKGQYSAQLLAETYGNKIDPSRLYNENTSPYLASQVNFYLNEIFPGVEIESKSSWEMQTAQTMIKNSVKKNFGLSTNVGYGISYLLPIIATGLIAKKGSIIIIENPEAHLHPAAQSKVGEFLAMVAATGTRVIVETHSDHLINGMQCYAVSNPNFILNIAINNFNIGSDAKTRQGKIKIDTIKLTENGDYTEWPDGFMDQGRKDLFNLYQARMKMQK